MKKYIFKTLFVAFLAVLASCNTLLEPEPDNHSQAERILREPVFAEGLLLFSYSRIPSNLTGYNFSETATDDAVTNLKANEFLRIGTGQWTANYNPFATQYTNYNQAIHYINTLLPKIDIIKWSSLKTSYDSLLNRRIKGECYGMRAFMRFNALQLVAGKDASGNLLGIPLYDEKHEGTELFNMPRATFQESVDSIYSDLNKAIALLPMDYKDISTVSALPVNYKGFGFTKDDYNLVNGTKYNQRFSGRIARAVKAKVALLAASPAFNESNDLTKWANAALYAAEVLSDIQCSWILNANGHKYYLPSYSDNLATIDAEMIWRSDKKTADNALEKRLLPPSLNGNGEINPSQNLVNAFPMKDGYPIDYSGNDITSVVFNRNLPYDNRDPRLDLYILRDKSVIQTKTIDMSKGVDSKDSLNISTRTSYYLRKLMREDIIFSTTTTAANKVHYAPYFRYTELFLIYAEAANQAWGYNVPGTGKATKSAKDIMKLIRARALGITSDSYLNSINNKEDMNKLIQNERRIELSFEGSRFWDIRRWKLDLTTPAMGVEINKPNKLIYNPVPVENRVYKPTMIYGPMLYQEVLKFPSLIQNAGW